MGTVRLPSEGMLIPLVAAPFKVIATVEAPSIVSGVELTRGLFENLKSELLHVSYQHYSTQVRVLLSRLLHTGIPNLQDLFTGFLNIGEGVIVSEGEDRGRTGRN